MRMWSKEWCVVNPTPLRSGDFVVSSELEFGVRNEVLGIRN
jgi:hypothetical protein